MQPLRCYNGVYENAVLYARANEKGMVNTMKCERCGFDNPDYLEYCQNCSAPLASKTEGKQGPSWGFVKAPTWADPDFSADTVSEDDVPADFVSEAEALRRAREEARIAREEARRAQEEAEAAKAAVEAEKAKLAAQAAAIKAAAEADRRAEEEKAQRAAEAAKARETEEAERRAAARRAEQQRLMDERRKAEEDAAAGNAKRSYRDYDDDDDDDEGGEGLLTTIGGMFRRREKTERVERPEHTERAARPAKPAPRRVQRPEKDDYRTYDRGSRSPVLSRAIKIAAIVAALAVLAVAAWLIIGKISSCNQAAKVPTVDTKEDMPGYYFVTVYGKEGDVLVYETPDGRRQEVTVDSKKHVVFKVPESSLMTVEPVESATYDAVPKIFVRAEDGTETQIENIPAITLSVPTIEVRWDNDDNIVSEDGSVTLSGHIDLIGTKLTVDGEDVVINQDGSFSHDLNYEEAGAHTIAVEGRLGGYQVYRHSFNVTVNEAHTTEALVQLPWEYGDTSFSQRVKNSVDTIEVRGQAPAGSDITVNCESSNAALSVPVVNDDGSFTFNVKMAYAGDYAISIICNTADGKVAERIIHVQRAPEYSTYLRGAWQMNYASFAYDSRQAYQIKGTVTEILEEGDYYLAMLELDSGDKLVIEYHPHYGSAGTIEVGKKYEALYGRPMGMNADGIPQAYIWFVED